MNASCIFFAFAVWLSLRADARVYSDCDKSEIRTDQCWRNHDEPPDCRHTDPLYACILNVVDQFPPHCPLKGKNQAQQKLGLSQFLYSTYCAQTNAYQEFQHKRHCWQSVRSCLQEMPISYEEIVHRYEAPSVVMKIEKYPSEKTRNAFVAQECYRQGEFIHLCYSSVTGCYKVESFVNAILEQSICAKYRIEDCPACAYNNTFMSLIIENGANCYFCSITVMVMVLAATTLLSVV